MNFLSAEYEVDRITPRKNGAFVSPRLTGLASQAIANSQPLFTEAARSGRYFMGGTQNLGGGLIAPLGSFPTTNVVAGLFNHDQNANGIGVLVDFLHVYLGNAAAPAAGAALFYAVGRLTTDPVPAESNVGSFCTSGAPRISKAKLILGGTFAVTPVWNPVFSIQAPAAANLGQGYQCRTFLGGRILIPPRYALALTIVAGAGAGGGYGWSIGWAEFELDIE
jgi:hypothetical protein